MNFLALLTLCLNGLLVMWCQQLLIIYISDLTTHWMVLFGKYSMTALPSAAITPRTVDDRNPCQCHINWAGQWHWSDIKAKSVQIVVLLNIFLNKGTSDSFVNLSPIFTIFRMPVNNYTVHMSYHFGCHGNHFGGNLCVTIDTKLLNY